VFWWRCRHGSPTSPRGAWAAHTKGTKIEQGELNFRPWTCWARWAARSRRRWPNSKQHAARAARTPPGSLPSGGSLGTVRPPRGCYARAVVRHDELCALELEARREQSTASSCHSKCLPFLSRLGRGAPLHGPRGRQRAGLCTERARRLARSNTGAVGLAGRGMLRRSYEYEPSVSARELRLPTARTPDASWPQNSPGAVRSLERHRLRGSDAGPIRAHSMGRHSLVRALQSVIAGAGQSTSCS